MKIENIDISDSIESAKKQMAEDKNLSPAIKSTFELLILIITLLVNRLGINSSNSSMPPSQDPNRDKDPKKEEDKKKIKTRKDKGIKRKPGAQPGHKGVTLEKSKNPDKVEEIEIDLRSIPPADYKNAGYDSRQVFDVEIKMNVKEYRAQILEDRKTGQQYVATFPDGVTKAVQYGNEVRAQAVYMSIFQMIPLARILDYFKEQAGLLVSKGSISNFKKVAYKKLEEIGFKAWVSAQLLASEVCNADETGINVNGKRIWLHALCNEKYTIYHPDLKRGKEAMDRMGILENYGGVLCHDHWKAYYKYKKCTHSLCNAHHLRELIRAFEQDGQRWAINMHDLLEDINEAVKKSDYGVLPENEIKAYQKRYRTILTKGKKECPLPNRIPGKKGRLKKSKARNLLERLIDYEDDTLRFMKEAVVPFTNNQGENDLRMTKVQQKISGCFRSMLGAEEFCLIRSYIVTARKHGMGASEALRILFRGDIPDFMK
jgi:transposase